MPETKQSYEIHSPIKKDGDLHKKGTIDLTEDEAKDLLECGAISLPVTEEPTPSKEGDDDDSEKNEEGGSGNGSTEGTSGVPDQSNPNRTPKPEDPAASLQLIKQGIQKMEANKKDGEWTKQSGPQLKPLAEVVGFEVTVDERNQAYLELHPKEEQ